MKKYIASFFGSLLTFSILATPVLAQGKAQVTPPSIEKKAEVMEKKDATGGAAMGKAATKKSDYILPYPGILPDHPLYALKRLRDQILDMLIVDPARKAEFYILQADKHLNMTVFLLDKGKAALAGGTSEQSYQFLAKAVAKVQEVQQGNKEVSAGLVDRLQNSLQKHSEVLTELIQKAEGQGKENLTKILENVAKLKAEVEKLK